MVYEEMIKENQNIETEYMLARICLTDLVPNLDDSDTSIGSAHSQAAPARPEQLNEEQMFDNSHYNNANHRMNDTEHRQN